MAAVTAVVVADVVGTTKAAAISWAASRASEPRARRLWKEDKARFGSAMVSNFLAGSQQWSAARPYFFRVEADFVTCTQ